MKIQTKWFGEIDTTEDKIITFEKGIIGFEDFKKFTIVVDAEKESENTIMWLQSAEEHSACTSYYQTGNCKRRLRSYSGR